MTYQESFIQFMVNCGVLRFGNFTLKSGRKAPYFINAGNYNNGSQLLKLGQYYATCIEDNKIPVETLFGPAYKGIPLATSTAIAMADQYHKTVNFCFDRKEIKDHGEGGMFVGKTLEDHEKVVIVEDVITSGKAIGEVYPKLKQAADVDITAVVISVDRKERALEGNLSAIQSIQETYGIPAYSIVTIDDIIEAMQNDIVPGKEHLRDMLDYRAQYGVE